MMVGTWLGVTVRGTQPGGDIDGLGSQPGGHSLRTRPGGHSQGRGSILQSIPEQLHHSRILGFQPVLVSSPLTLPGQYPALPWGLSPPRWPNPHRNWFAFPSSITLSTCHLSWEGTATWPSSPAPGAWDRRQTSPPGTRGRCQDLEQGELCGMKLQVWV